MEEDSFKLRVNKIFGSLNSSSTSAFSSSASASTPSSLNSLWCLTDEEIVRKEWNRDKDIPEQPEPESNSVPKYDHPTELDKDLEDLDDEEEEVEDKSLSTKPAKPDDYNDEEWEVKSCIGLDCTLDFEEEEDEYDKVAVGDEKPEEIDDYGIDIDSGNVLPTSFKQVTKDPRANHLAAKLRLKEDAEAANNIDQAVDTASNVSNPKSILKRKDNTVDSRSLKRVRFDPECKDNDNGGDTDAAHADDFGAGVPDFLRNPSRYTHYTFDDSSSELNEESNKQAYMDFFNMMKRSSNSDDDRDASGFDSFGSVTFIPRKKSGDTNAMVDSCTELVQQVGINKDVSPAIRRGVSISIAAVDVEESEVSAMEEDEPESMADRKSNSQKPGRQYRMKARSESDE
ncbi:uncharacterized protein LOC133816974 [Humulus lupulus]|uniref:uncharacterized protein LOC133816974 n=1 Tax=Humulus lupulus TaxID=3486 RepID=UPI002B415AF8|nr:uncharacterized protein LOC133816974 [Humulus lupulus]